MAFVVIVQKGLDARAFGPFRTFKAASANAKAWDGVVLPLEGRDAPAPWDAAAFPGLPETPRRSQ